MILSWKALLLLLVCGLFYIFSIRETPIYDETEGQYAGAVVEMQSIFDLPKNHGIPRLQKPPFVYQIMELSTQLLGESEFSVRFPFVLFLIGVLGVTGWIAGQFLSQKSGALSILFLATMLGFFVFGRMIMPEIIFSFWILSAVAVLAKIHFLEGKHRERDWIIFWILLSLAGLTKGLHGFLWPLLAVGLSYRLGYLNQNLFRGFFNVRILLILLISQLPWYLGVEMRFPGFIRENLWNEQMGHALDFRDPPTYSRVSLQAFILQHLGLLFPAILFLPFCWMKKGRDLQPSKDLQFERFLWVFVGSVGITSAFSARQDYYTLVAWPVLSILIARAVLRSRSSFGFICGGVALLGIGLLGVSFMEREESRVVFRSDTTDQFFSVLSQMPSEIRFSMKIAGVSFLVGSGMGLFSILQKKYIRVPWMIALSMIGALVGAMIGFQTMGSSFSLKSTAKAMQAMNRQEWTVVVDGPHQLCSSLLFYDEGPIYFVRANPRAEFGTRVHQIGRERYLEEENFLKLWNSDQKIGFIYHEKDRDYWKKQLGERWKEIPEARSGPRQLVLNDLQ